MTSTPTVADPRSIVFQTKGAVLVSVPFVCLAAVPIATIAMYATGRAIDFWKLITPFAVTTVSLMLLKKVDPEIIDGPGTDPTIPTPLSKKIRYPLIFAATGTIGMLIFTGGKIKESFAGGGMVGASLLVLSLLSPHFKLMQRKTQ